MNIDHSSDATPALDKVRISAADKESILAVLKRMRDAWAQGDADAYSVCFTEDSDHITFNGMHLRGRNENAQLHGPLFRSVLKGTTIDPDVIRIELISPTIALVHTANGRKKSLQTFVLVKAEAGWLIRSFQNTRKRPLSIWITRLAQKRGSR